VRWRQAVAEIKAVPLMAQEIDYLIELVEHDLRDRVKSARHEPIPQWRIEKRAKVDAVQAVRERLSASKTI
jgi:hypothetical protein